jgi:hypothetical protein
LIAWFGEVPHFHDAEIVSLNLNRRDPSTLTIHFWRRLAHAAGFAPNVMELEGEIVVTFTIEGIMDLQLDGFSHQNVIFGLALRRAPDRPDRRPFYGLDSSPTDYELELEPCYGLAGRIRARTIRVEFTPGKPADAND